MTVQMAKPNTPLHWNYWMEVIYLVATRHQLYLSEYLWGDMIHLNGFTVLLTLACVLCPGFIGVKTSKFQEEIKSRKTVCSYWFESGWWSPKEVRSNTLIPLNLVHSKCSGYCRLWHVLVSEDHHSAPPFAEQIAGLGSNTRPCLNRLILHRHQPNWQEITQSQTWKYHQFWAGALSQLVA